MKIADLISVPPVRTVIRLSDLRHPERSRELAETFVLTNEAEEALATILEAVAQGQGRGFFLQGNYGSGKSHLLTVLSLLLEQPEAWGSLPGLGETALARLAPDPVTPKQEGTNPAGTGLRPQDQPQPGPQVPSIRETLPARPTSLDRPAGLWPGRYLVLNISLVEHSGGEYLEDVLLDQLRQGLRALTGQDPGLDLKGQFVREMARIIAERYPGPLETFCREKDLPGPSDLFQVKNSALIGELLEILGLPYRPLYQREAAWQRAWDLLQQHQLSGLVVLLDELSEFLRSEPDSRHFNEDIRFLQFLGEAAQTNPCWIVASLQERIEDTGEVYPEVFRKIADRFPVRLQLTGRHLRELIIRRLLRQRVGAREFARSRYALLREAFGSLPFNQEEFVALYPVHPMTVEFLEALKTLLSQERGAVDFIHYQIKGDPARQIPGLLAEPAETTLGPERIFDHFKTRIRERQETRRFIEEVFPYFEREIPGVFSDPEDQALTLRVIKLLILAASSPAPWRLTLRQLAQALLYPVTDLDSDVNYAHLRDLLQTLVTGGMYLAVEPSFQGQLKAQKQGGDQGAGQRPLTGIADQLSGGPTGAADDPWGERYFLDLSVDVGEIIRQRVRFLAAGFFPGDRRFLEKLAPWVDDRELPLANLVRDRQQAITTRWNFTRREGLLILQDLSELPLNTLKELAQQAATTEKDFIVILGEPTVAPQAAKIENLLRVALWPELAHLGAEAFRFWLPEPWPDEELLRQALAHLLLWEEYQRDDSPLGQQVRDYLESLLHGWRQRVLLAFRQAYLAGKVYTGTGKAVLDLKLLGTVPWADLLDRIIFPVLRERYPRHQDCAPQAELLLPTTVTKTLEGFLLPGKVAVAGLDPILRQGLEGFLKPLRLVVKEGGEYRLELDPDKSLALKGLLAEMTEEQVPLEELYWRLRKGPLGLTREAFTFLALALLASGTLSARRNERRVDVAQVTADSFWKIETLVREEELAEEDLDTLAQLTFLPVKLARGPLTTSRRRELWEEMVAFKKNMAAELEWLKGRLPLAESGTPTMGGAGRSLAGLPLERIVQSVARVEEVLDEIKVTFAPREGLSRFLLAYRQSPLFEAALAEVRSWIQFFRADLDDLLFIEHYLSSPALVVPEEEPWGEIGRERERLLGQFQEAALYTGAERRQELRRGFEDFRRRYIPLYVDAHRRQLGPERLAYLERWRESPTYRLLEELGRLEFIPGRDWADEVNSLIEGALARGCNRVDEKLLFTQPVCQCGWKPGEKVQLPSSGEIQRLLEDGLVEYLKNLRQPAYAGKILAFARGLEEAGQEDLGKVLRELAGEPVRVREDESSYSGDSSQTHRDGRQAIEWTATRLPSLGKLQRLVNRQTIKAINDALRGRVILVERDLDELYRCLVQRRIPVAELRRVFEDWLSGGGPLAADLLVKVEGKRTVASRGQLDDPSDGGPGSARAHPFPGAARSQPDDPSEAGAGSARPRQPQGAFGGQPEDLFNRRSVEVGGNDDPDGHPRQTEDLFDRRSVERLLTWHILNHAPAELEENLSHLVDQGDRKVPPVTARGEGAQPILSQAGRDVVILGLRLVQDLRDLAARRDLPSGCQGWEEVFASQLSLLDLNLSSLLQQAQQLDLHLPEELLRKETEAVKRRYRDGFRTFYGENQDKAGSDPGGPWRGLERGQTAGRRADQKRPQADAEQRPGSHGQTAGGRADGKRPDLGRLLQAPQGVWAVTVKADGKRPDLGRLLQGTVRDHLLRTEAARLYLVWLDGLRHDLWVAMKGDLEKDLGGWGASGTISPAGWSLLEEGFLWAAYPTTTEVQLKEWQESGAFTGEAVTIDSENKRGGHWQQAIETLANDPWSAPRFLIRFGFPDDKIHWSRDDLLTLQDEIRLQGERLLGGFLAAVPRGSLVVLFSDHGFRENPSYTPGDKTSPRYLHGGDWPEEVLAPWAILLR